MSKIKQIYAREILDSRGNPTVQSTVILSDGINGTSSCPSGSSKGTYEAIELRDGDPEKNDGMGVLKAIENVNNVISPRLQGIEVSEQQKLDKIMIELDGTQNKARLGANAILSVSQAIVKAAAKSSLMPTSLYIRQFVNGKFGKRIPTPMFNLIEGGEHSNGSINFQEFLVIPATSKSYKEALSIGTGIYHALRNILLERNETVLVADEGGFSPNLDTNATALALLKQAVEKSGFSLSYEVFMGMDVAANSFMEGKIYKLSDRPVAYNTSDLIDFYLSLVKDYPIIYIEDPLGEDDWEGWKKAYLALHDKTLIVGDDLITTNPYRLQLALDNNVVGGVVIKPNQIGTITEAIAVAEIARYKGLKLIVSHRSGETNDNFLADFAVGIGADYVKFGAPARERIVKYNRLLEIESDLENFL